MSSRAVVVGSGPNGLAGAVVLARAGLDVTVYEAAATIGGGVRTSPLIDDDVPHDLCSAIHPLAAASPFFRRFDLPARVDLIHPEISYAHPMPSGGAGLAFRDLERTSRGLGADAEPWRRLMRPLVERSGDIVDLLLSDQRHLVSTPRACLTAAARIAELGTPLAGRRFHQPTAAAMLAGVAAHAGGRLPSLPGGAVAVLLAHLAHSTGWPLVRGGSQRIADALVDDLMAHGGRVIANRRVDDIRELRDADIVLLDLSPRGVVEIAGAVVPATYGNRLRAFRYGHGVCKVDFLVSEPVPWTIPDVGRAGTVHLGGDQRTIFATESRTAAGQPATPVFTLLSEPANFDPVRARDGKYPVWSYCHAPNGDDRDTAEEVQAHIERHAPGFGDTVLARTSTPPSSLAARNPNYVGGDIGSGAVTLSQMLLRPTWRWLPHSTPMDGVYLCSSSTLPGPGVHGMGGYFAAREALDHEFGLRSAPDLAPDAPDPP